MLFYQLFNKIDLPIVLIQNNNNPILHHMDFKIVNVNKIIKNELEIFEYPTDTLLDLIVPDLWNIIIKHHIEHNIQLRIERETDLFNLTYSLLEEKPKFAITNDF